MTVAGHAQGVYPAAKSGGNYMHNYYLPPAGSSSPWWPSWSPDGKWLAFAMDGSIWKLRPGDAAAYEIIYAKEYLSSPEWSPDGKWLAYTADDDGKSINLMLMNFETGRSTALTTGAHVNIDPAWSPDGKRLAYVSTEPNGRFNIFVMDIENGRKTGAIAVTTDNSFGRERLYFGEFDVHISPTWSPDGKELIFVSNRGIPLGSGAIWRAPVEADVMNTGKAKMIHKEQTLFRTRPHWSPDGKRIVYSSHLGHQYTNLFVLPADGGEPYKMTFGEYDSFHPRWSPDGEWIAYISNEQGLPQLKLLKSWGGRQQLIRNVFSRHWSRPMGTVSVRVLDEVTREETPARIYPKASDGKAYTPVDSYERLSSLSEHLFHTPGKFTVMVPPGPYSVEAVKGFEYWPVKETVEVKAGQSQPVILTLKRMTNLKAKGWYSGSNHVHMNYAGNLHNTPENLFLMNAAEDAGMIGHQVANKDNRILDYQYFVPGRAHHPLSTRERIMVTGQEYRPPFYGHISLFNLKEHLISPFTTGYEGTAIESLYPSNTDIFRFAKQQGAIGAYVHPFGGPVSGAQVRDPLETNLGIAKAFPVDVALETISYHELWSTASEVGLIPWHHALNNGFKVPATGGEDSISSLHRTALVGSMRGYFLLGPGKLTWENYMAALLKGRGFVTNGPLVEFRAGQAMPGDEIRLTKEGGSITFRGILHSIVPLDRLELVNNGKIIERIALAGDRRHAEFEKELRVTESGWYTLQALANARVHPVEDTRPMATTNPIYVYVGDQQIRSRESADYFVRWIDKLALMAAEHPGWRSEKEKQHVLAQFKEAQEIYRKRGAEAK
jgi:dipeptidyl aminopeptidase/acylaminoacyl peptidase